MPIWLAILFGSVPGVIGLFVAVWRMGAMHNEVKSVVERVSSIPKMAEDIAYLKGRLDGTDKQDVLDRISVPRRSHHRQAGPRPL